VSAEDDKEEPAAAGWEEYQSTVLARIKEFLADFSIKFYLKLREDYPEVDISGRCLRAHWPRTCAGQVRDVTRSIVSEGDRAPPSRPSSR
jgi:hypothetical protein